MRSILVGAVGAVGVIFPSAPPDARGAALQYEVVEVVTPGAASVAYAINNSGQVAGTFWAVDPQTCNIYTRGFVYTPGSGTTTIGTHPGGTDSSVSAINAHGQVAGWTIFFGQDNMHRGFIADDGGAFQDVGTLGGTFASVEGINDNGQAVGRSTGPVGVHDLAHAFRYDLSTNSMLDLGTLGGGASSAGAVNNHGDVVGASEYSALSINWHAFLYRDGSMADLGTLGGDRSYAADINDAGQIVGSSTTGAADDLWHAFLYSGGTMTGLGTLPGMSISRAEGINSGGDIVGSSRPSVSSSTKRAFLYSGGMMYDLNAMIPPSSGWTLESASAINDAGQIVGTGNFGGGSRAFLLTPVPEPASGLFALSAVLLVFHRRRRHTDAPRA